MRYVLVEMHDERKGTEEVANALAEAGLRAKVSCYWNNLDRVKGWEVYWYCTVEDPKPLPPLVVKHL